MLLTCFRSELIKVLPTAGVCCTGFTYFKLVCPNLEISFFCHLFDGQFWPVPLLKLHRSDISAPLQIGSDFFFCTVWGKLFLTGSSYIFISFVRLINATASSLGCLKYLEERKRFMHIFAAELDLVEILLDF